ncbi:MAG: PorT family protein [Bacteroidetes bacterium]|nr:MAG: PorT family protein [Bacteroidota bacterium]
MRHLTIILAVFCLCNWSLYAQGELSGGFKTGLNFNRLDGPQNTGVVYDNNTGFHIGASFLYSITDLFGLKGELLYSQKGTQATFEGDSYFVFYPVDGGEPIFANGRRRSDITIANSYIDIPLMVYFRLGRVELEAGVNAAMMIGSTGSGAITFSGSTPQGSTIEEFTSAIDARYYSDDPGAASIRSSKTAILSNTTVFIPTTIGGYYEGPMNDEKRFNRFDFGLNAGLSIFLNQGLYIGGRLNYGLTDVTRAGQDLDLRQLGDDNTFITRDEMDRNLSIQTSVGFRF